MKRLLDKRGARSAEYAILVVGVAAVVMFGIEAFEKWIVPLFENAASIFK